MQAVHATLASGQQGAKVANLHAALDRLRFGGPVTRQERADQRYGEGTFAAVRDLQGQFQIVTQQPGVVDEQTAEVINRQLFARGMFQTVKGQVTRRDGRPVVGKLVFAFDKDNVGGVNLGQAFTAAEGSYRIFYDPKFYALPGEGVLRVKEIIDLIVQLYDEHGATLASSAPIHAPVAEVQVNIEVDDRPVDPSVAGWREVVQALSSQTQKLSAINTGTDRLISIDEKIGELGKSNTVGPNARGDSVRTIQTQLIRLGVDLPANETNDGVFGVGTRDALLQLQEKYGLNKTGQVDDATRTALDVAVNNVVHPNRLEGRIFLENGLPAAGIKLRMINKGFGESAAALGPDIVTDSRGFYALSYFASADGAAANIEVHAIDEAGTPIRLSTPIANADRSEVLNLIAPARVKSLSSEFSLMSSDLAQAVRGDLTQLANAREDDEHDDLSLLHRSSGWDARLIATAANAAKASTETNIPQDALYGVLRAGLPSDAEALAMISDEAFAAALTQATKAGVVALDETQLNGANDDFRAFKLKKRLTMIAPGTLSTMSAVLANANMEQSKKEKFEKIVALHDDDDHVGLWEKAREAGLSAEIDQLQMQGKLAYLTLNNAPLSAALQREIRTQGELPQLVEKDFYRADRWETKLKELATTDNRLDEAVLAELIPPTYTQAALLERLTAYAEDMSLQVRQAYPTQVAIRRIENRELELGAQHDVLKAPIQTFLKNAADKGFQLGRVPVSQFIQRHGADVFEGVAEDQKTLAVEGVNLLTRVYQMTPNDAAMTTLLELGFNSAWQVTAVPKVEFVERYWERFGSRKVTETVWEKSSQVTSVTFNIYTRLKQIDSTPPLMALSGSPTQHDSAKKELQNLLKDYPTMESLFGSLDFCDCGHCRSVLSPAAYLVDLLRFLDPPKQAWEQTMKVWNDKRGTPYPGLSTGEGKPYDALMLRRPDLPHLPLTCENTNTALPYVDLVNEILEYFVDKNGIDKNAVRDTGSATSAELLAEPHNLIPGAYEKLKKAKHPLPLPFDLWLETTRRFCDYFERPFWQLLDVFRPAEDLFSPEDNPEAYHRADVFAEYLGLSPDEYAIYTDSKFTQWPSLFGYDNETEAEALANLKSASTLARRLGVTYKDLADLLQTEFVNPHLVGLTLLHTLGLELRDVFRYKEHPGYAPLTTEEKIEFDQRLADATTKFQASLPGFDALQRLDQLWAGNALHKIVRLRDEDAGCNFDKTQVLYSDGSEVSARDFVKLNLFVRLWRRLGWTMEEIDRALTTFIRSKLEDLALADGSLGRAMKTALVYMAHLKELDELVNAGKNSRLKLITLWSGLSTTGKHSLYSQLFLTRSVLNDDSAFDHPLGEYLSDANRKLKDHVPALQAALNLTVNEVTQILRDGNTVDEAELDKAQLSLDNTSLLYRYGLLAKSLGLSVAEMIALKALSGLHPFRPLEPGELTDIEKDYPLQHTLAFVRAARAVKSGPLTVSDLEYLFLHRFDAKGKYREGDATQMVWLRPLAIGLRAIIADFAAPASADAVSDDVLREKMLLVFAPGVVEQFMGFWLNKAVFSATRKPLTPAQRLQPPARYSLPGVLVAYDETRQSQQVAYTGMLTSEAKQALLEQIPETASDDQQTRAARELFGDLLAEIVIKSQTQFKEYFDRHFDGLLTFEEFTGANADVATTPQERRHKLLTVILPFLRARLIRQTIGQALATQTGGDLGMVERLVTRADFLALPDAAAQPLLSQFIRLGEMGLTFEPFESLNFEHALEKAIVKDIEVKADSNVKSARWRAYFDVAQAGAYRMYAELGKKDGAVMVRVEAADVATGVTDPLIIGTASSDRDVLSESIELKPGILYGLHVEADNLQNGAFSLSVKGETTPKGPVSQLAVTPHDAVIASTQAYTMLSKAVQLAQALGLSERELRHILANPVDFGKLNWRQLPVEKSDANADALFISFLSLLEYVSLQRDLTGGGDGLIAVFERARLKMWLSTEQETGVKSLCEQFASLTRRELAAVQDVATELKMRSPTDFADVGRLTRLWQALQVVETFGVPMASLKKWLTPRPDATTAMDVRSTIKARYAPETWQRIAKSIFDPLRARQRDALVAHIMHLKPELTSVEKLFEYFLIDPGMEPVVQTSRLRLAISSLQTFIQRCFLNLEPLVHPSVLNAEHWAWMKRYRVWEANRKIFLFPENWLEPEWRDDKTHLYQELESTLLQGDVTNQLAEDALYVYLKKLDQLARLDMVTMYAEERPLGPPTLHVIGRTHAQPRQYFYRRYAHGMWTPWEPVSAEIDGDHVVAVMWRDRLHLFWLTFIEKVEAAGAPSSNETGNLAELQLNKLVSAAATTAQGAVNRILDIQLNWSEYLQGEWTTREASGFGNTVELGQKRFYPQNLFVTVRKKTDPETGVDAAVEIILNGLPTGVRGFTVVSKNGIPSLHLTDEPKLLPYALNYASPNTRYNRITKNSQFSVTFVKEAVTVSGIRTAEPAAPRTILDKCDSYSLLPTSNFMTLPNVEFAPLISPIFYVDDINTFFVEPSLTETTVNKWEGYTITRPSQKSKWNEFINNLPRVSVVIPPKYLQEALRLSDAMQPQPPNGIDPRGLHALKPNLDILTQSNVAVQFGDSVIGRAGRVRDLAGSGIARIVTDVGDIL